MKNTKTKLTIMVIGATGKIGKKLVHYYVQNDHKVICVNKNPKTTVSDQSIESYQIDFTQQSQVKKFANLLAQKKITIDIVINCIGGLCKEEKINNITESDIYNVFALNLFSVFFSIQYLNPLIKSGGMIVNFSGGGAIEDTSYGSFILYPCAKAAVLRLTEILSNIMLSFNIYVVAIDPGWVIGEDDLEYIKKNKISDLTIKSGYDSAHLIEYLYNNKNKNMIGRLFRVFDKYQNYNLNNIKKDSLMLRYIPFNQ